MTKIQLFAGLLGLILLTSACRKDSPDPASAALDDRLETALTNASTGEGVDFFKLPDSDDFNAIPQDPRNPLTAEKVTLGQMLFHETGLALVPKHHFSKNTYSCASCHFAEAGFQAGRIQGLGDGGIGIGNKGEGRSRSIVYREEETDAQPFRSPSVLHVAYQKNMLWNGQFGATGLNAGTEAQWTENTPKAVNHLGYEGTETQAIAGLEVHRLRVDTQDEITLFYQTYFDAAFPDVPAAERYNEETAGLAIAAYERTLTAAEAPFQKWLRGDKNAMNETEKRGALVFFESANCADCHTGPALSSMEFYALGLNNLSDCPEEILRADSELSDHLGRGNFTGNPADNHKFKVPQLYNLADSPFYGHGSSLRSLREVVEYKNQANPQNPNVPAQNLAEAFTPQNLTEQQIADLTAFLTHALYDENLQRFVPSSVVSGNCFPNNDPMSRSHSGCD